MKASFDINTASFSSVTAKLHRKKNDAIFAGKKVVHDTAELVLTDSRLRVPNQTGALARSGKVVNQDTNYTAISIIGFGVSSINPATGKTTASYAGKQNESPHNAKSLENSILDFAPIYKEELHTQISRALS